jgi:hypothetical protein
MTTIIAKTGGIIGKSVLFTNLWKLEPTPEPTLEPTPWQKAPGYGQNPPGFCQKAPGFGKKAAGFGKKAAGFGRGLAARGGASSSLFSVAL